MKNHYHSIGEELLTLHDDIRQQWPALNRIAVALYDSATGLLHTFIRSNAIEAPLSYYSSELDKVPSLKALADSGESRLLQDVSFLSTSPSKHSQFVSTFFRASYTEPVYLGSELLGFIFYDAGETNYFSDELLSQLRSYTRLIEALIISEVLPIKAMIGMVDTAKEMTHLRDAETGRHLIRMSHYMVLIASVLAEKHEFTEEHIEYMLTYAPLHDLGKIAIPDGILMKPSKLTVEEYDVIKTHVDEGVKMIDKIVQNFGFQKMHYLELLKQIVGEHHERWDGSGYPKGLKGEEISIVGRIAAVADVFDALSATRVYRPAMPLEDVFDYLCDNRGTLFDAECVEALLSQKEKVIEIHHKFAEEFSFE